MDVIKIIHTVTEPTRFKIIQLLFEHHYCVHAISKKLKISDSAVSQHMNILKKYSIVTGSKIGYQMHYKVNEELLNNLIGNFLDSLSQNKKITAINNDCTCEFVSQCTRRDKSGRGGN